MATLLNNVMPAPAPLFLGDYCCPLIGEYIYDDKLHNAARPPFSSFFHGHRSTNYLRGGDMRQKYAMTVYVTMCNVKPRLLALG